MNSRKSSIGSSNSHSTSSGGGMLDSPPHVVTPTKEPPGSPMLHTPTATHGGLTHASPFRPGGESLRYSLGTVPRNTVSSSLLPTSPPGRTRKSTPITSSAAAVAAASNSKQLLRQDPNACKIFLLLLQPQSKIFELIQLLYAPQDTSVGDLIDLIPSNATEPALGSQDYVGLCRPKTQQELLDLDLLASSSHAAVPSAQIVLGEILVAIPRGYTGPTVATLSKQILSNPKIVKLLKRADPLAPKQRHGSRRHRSHKHRSSNKNAPSSSKFADHVHVLEKHDEVDESIEEKIESERRMQQAMQHAAAEAAAANAACGGRKERGLNAVGGAGMDNNNTTHANNMAFANSMNSHDSFSAGEMTNSTLGEEYSQQESLDESFSSWSKSFDASFSAQASICSGVTQRASRRKLRHERRTMILKRCAVVGFLLMVFMYWMDPQKDHLKHQFDVQVQTPMGATGIFQWAFLLLVLYKMERLTRLNRAAYHYEHQHSGIKGTTTTPTPVIYMTEQRSCPFLKAAGRALDRFKNKYSKRLKRLAHQQQKQQPYEEVTRNQPERVRTPGSHQLRTFSLKASNGSELRYD